MPSLPNYAHFAGTNWTTGTIHNALAYQGYTAPHTGEAYSEALLMGISGGLVFGYFPFHYEGHDPQINLLTRNTFNNYGFDPITERLAIALDVLHTTKADKARQNLVEALENGEAPIVWADMYSLPYNAANADQMEYAVFPLIVHGYDQDTAQIADRAHVGLTAPAATLDAARSRVKKDKHRLITLSAPNPDKLPSAVQKGIWDCIKLFTEKPPKGSANSFGFKAYQRWAQLLTKATAKGSWAKTLPPGRDLYSGLLTAFDYGLQLAKDERLDGERGDYAAFLREASTILNNAALNEVATHFETSATKWQALSQALLPDNVPLLKQTRDLLTRRYHLFMQQGNASVEQVKAINTQVEELKQQADDDFPLSDVEVTQLQANIADAVLDIHDAEQTAITALQEAMHHVGEAS